MARLPNVNISPSRIMASMPKGSEKNLYNVVILIISPEKPAKSNSFLRCKYLIGNELQISELRKSLVVNELRQNCHFGNGDILPILPFSGCITLIQFDVSRCHVTSSGFQLSFRIGTHRYVPETAYHIWYSRMLHFPACRLAGRQPPQNPQTAMFPQSSQTRQTPQTPKPPLPPHRVLFRYPAYPTYFTQIAGVVQTKLSRQNF